MRSVVAVILACVMSVTLLSGGETMFVKSPAFENGGEIPAKYGCHGEDISIPLEFGNIPGGTKSLALIMEDPDAPMGLFVHWVVYNMPATLRGLPEGVPPAPELDYDIRQGINDFGKIGYGGPCPPDRPHRYFIRFFALDVPLPLEPGIDRNALLAAMKGHILAEAELMGIYPR